jgi:Photosynthesis affected mutant 68
MSASWDPDREGSFLGGDEFQKNLDNIKEGLGRSRENAVLRDKMSGLSPEDLNLALQDLERREKDEGSNKRQSQSLESKLKDELE